MMLPLEPVFFCPHRRSCMPAPLSSHPRPHLLEPRVSAPAFAGEACMLFYVLCVWSLATWASLP